MITSQEAAELRLKYEAQAAAAKAQSENEENRLFKEWQAGPGEQRVREHLEHLDAEIRRVASVRKANQFQYKMLADDKYSEWVCYRVQSILIEAKYQLIEQRTQRVREAGEENVCTFNLFVISWAHDYSKRSADQNQACARSEDGDRRDSTGEEPESDRAPDQASV